MNRFAQFALVGLLALSLGACSTIQGWFPDKQKEYRYSSEIPPLEIPPDVIGPTPDVPANDVNAAAEPNAIADSPIGKYRPAAPGAAESASLDKDDAGAYIHIEAPFANAWTMAEKAIHRMRIEIKDKDRSEKVLFVYYSEDAKPFEPSWTDDILSPFVTSHRDDEREYRIQLEEKGDVLTKIRVLNSDGKVQSDGEGYKLLKSIHQKILILSQPEPEPRRSGLNLLGKPEDEEPEE